MSVAQILEELPTMTFEERQMIVQRALELDECDITDEEAEMAEREYAAHLADPSTSMSLEEVKRKLDAKYKK